MQRGRELEIFERSNPWLRVRADGKTEGWVHGNYVGDAAAVRAALQKDLARRSSSTRKKRPVAPPTQPATEPQAPQETQTTQPSLGALSIDGMIVGMPDDMILEEVDPLEGQPRLFWRNGQWTSRTGVLGSRSRFIAIRNYGNRARYIRCRLESQCRPRALVYPKCRTTMATRHSLGRKLFAGIVEPGCWHRWV